MIASVETMHPYSVTVGHDSSATKEEWDQYVQSNPLSSCYHLSAWMRSIEKAYGHSCHWIVARRKKGVCDGGENHSEICGILPLVHIKHFVFGNSLVSLPFADLGGVLADDPAVEEALLRFAAELRGQVGAYTVELRSNEGHTATNMMRDLAIDASSWKVIMTRELPDDPNRLFQEFKPKLRSQIRKPEKEGMKFRIGDASLLDDFYKVFCQNMRDLGSPVHSREWFRNVAECFGQKSHFGVAYHEGKPIAAGMILSHMDTVSIPWASSLRKFNVLGSNMFLYWNFMKFACENGIKKFDFGRCTIGSGTQKFKEQWGAIGKPVTRFIIRQNGINEFINFNNVKADGNLKKEFFIRIWKNVPIIISNIIGPKIRKYISL